ncbi:MAG: PAS domain S-box protein [Acidobacteria bacterium]|nr:PAS domain S-box protein [Acidobacteriota bacterium]
MMQRHPSSSSSGCDSRQVVAKTAETEERLFRVGEPTFLDRILRPDESLRQLRAQLLWIAASRAVVLLLGINLASPLGILPSHIGSFPAAALWSILTVTLTCLYLALWWSGRFLRAQLYLQIAGDLMLTTILVAQTHGVASTFVSFYLLVIITCSMTLGRNGGMGGAALSTILYTGIVSAEHTGLLPGGAARPEPSRLAFQLGIHTLGFFGVAFLGAHLSQRIQAVQKELDERTDSLNRLRGLNALVVRSIRSGLATTDLQGRIVSYNTAAEELTQRGFTQVLGQPISEVMGDGLWLQVLKTDFTQDTRPLRHEDWITLPNGCRRFLGFSVSPLQDEQRQRLGYIVSFQDLTEIKRLEEEVRIKERMAAIGHMAAGIAHEIRNPLTSMRGSAEILRSHASTSESDKRLLDILMRESDRLNRFVEDFLSFARPRDSARELVDLKSLLQDSVALLENSPEVRAQHSVVLKTSPGEIRVLANAGQLRQVFWNLARNALHAMPGGGSLTVVAGPDRDEGAVVEFEDEGIGMTAEEKERLFQPFQSGFARGTGLGLSIVYQIVRDHGGRIEVESEKGKGTRVLLYLPSRPCKAADFGEVSEDAICTARG